MFCCKLVFVQTLRVFWEKLHFLCLFLLHQLYEDLGCQILFLENGVLHITFKYQIIQSITVEGGGIRQFYDYLSCSKFLSVQYWINVLQSQECAGLALPKT